MAELPPIPVLSGPTGSGKSSLAHQLAREFPIEIIVADSRQVIKQLDIGTEKPTAQEQHEVRYHLIDLVEPGEMYTAFRFVHDAEAAIEDIVSRNRIPMIVGGTGLYIRALVQGLSVMQSSPELREELEEELQERGEDALYDELKRVDPETAVKFEPQNHVRLIRALEIYRLSGQTKSSLEKEGKQIGARYRYHQVTLLPDREELYNRINARSLSQLANGLLKEVEGLVQKGMKEAVLKANVICYNELLGYLGGATGYNDCVAMIQQNCRRLAKRQYTWFRKENEAQQVTSVEAARDALGDVLSRWKIAD